MLIMINALPKPELANSLVQIILSLPPDVKIRISRALERNPGSNAHDHSQSSNQSPHQALSRNPSDSNKRKRKIHPRNPMRRRPWNSIKHSQMKWRKYRRFSNTLRFVMIFFSQSIRFYPNFSLIRNTRVFKIRIDFPIYKRLILED